MVVVGARQPLHLVPVAPLVAAVELPELSPTMASVEESGTLDLQCVLVRINAR